MRKVIWSNKKKYKAVKEGFLKVGSFPTFVPHERDFTINEELDELDIVLPIIPQGSFISSTLIKSPNVKEPYRFFSKEGLEQLFGRISREEKLYIRLKEKLAQESKSYIDIILDEFKDKFSFSQLNEISSFLDRKGDGFMSEFINWLRTERKKRLILPIWQELKNFMKVFFSQFKNIVKNVLISYPKITNQKFYKPQIFGFNLRHIITDTLFYSFASEEDNKLYLRNISGTLSSIK